MHRPLPHSRFSAVLLAVVLAALPARAAEFTVKAETIPEMKAVFGQVESRIVVPARARIGGSIRELGVSQGDEVREGEVIAVVVDDKLTLQLTAADAKIEALNSQLENARLQLERAQQLRASGTGSQASLDQATMLFEVATNQVAAARAEKAVIAQSSREGDVLAPATGRILTVPVTPGSVVLPGEVIVRIAPGPYYLRLSLPERHAAEIVQDSQVLVGGRGLTQGPGALPAARRGRIVKVYPEIAEGRVIADVEVGGIGDYFVNERTLVRVPVGKRKVLAVPPDAVRTVHGVDYVRIAAGGGPMDVAVILGESFGEGGERRVEILSGLRDGDRVLRP
ncbi:efflux RND transporter periplasmic adaptor subunit [Bosea sp. (in: a-proteobacteria)]|uniref:efflux RND transporter periplasmic adaptor subunit n=1 Tax=Bosea sp. (in: a-proteobacteria) TaxID=1871050 RepID=UPI002607692F|nr:efflux RND transporter periplasmic adaptor subunit [Bosea sp. (in: a-proteobacteria)]MCO5091370.1 efflux RND transporter periplasmic adaptor subunit [Bosea sp. (in: a-proteobacteria)]